MSYRRLLWLVVILLVLAVYFPVNRLIHGGIQTQLPLDRSLPLFPPAVVPYLFGDILFVGFPVWAAVKAKPIEFEAYAISIILAAVTSYIIYLVFPTYITRPEINPTDIFSRMLLTVYQTDRAANTAPSGHTFYSVLSLLYLARWRPNYRLAGIIVTFIILASTLLTKQHYIVDIISGIALAVLAYLTGRYIQQRWNLKFASG
jgi:membrane-associated phospholipid phosphatase